MYKIREKPIEVQCGLTQYRASIVGNKIFFFFSVSEKSDQNASHTGGSPGPVGVKLTSSHYGRRQRQNEGIERKGP